MDTLSLQPQDLFRFFEEITRIPRPSKHEEKIRSYLQEFASARHLNIKEDKAGNILISKPASKGKEAQPSVVLQSHMDMVCEKDNETIHDFLKDPLTLYIDGEWLKAKGTTLGADNGIGVAAALAVLDSQEIEHGPIEALFTVDEETGLTGAFALEKGFFDSKMLINLDSEDEGEIFVGCAGGVGTEIEIPYQWEDISGKDFAFKVSVAGLQGGHSGDDIEKGRGNANVLLIRFLSRLKSKIPFAIAKLHGGNLHNAIPRQAYAVCAISSQYKEQVRILLNLYIHDIEQELLHTDNGFTMHLESEPLPLQAIPDSISEQIIDVLHSCPHGVMAMSFDMPGMVETSTNFASIRMTDRQTLKIVTSQRSFLESAKWETAFKIHSLFSLVGAKVTHGEGYPGWKPNLESALLQQTVDAYKRLNKGKEPRIRAIHAGLECGLFSEKYPGLEMISFGPTMRGVHSPQERLHIPSVQLFWDHLKELLSSIS